MKGIGNKLLVLMLVAIFMFTGCAEKDNSVMNASETNATTNETEVSDTKESGSDPEETNSENNEPVTLTMVIWGAPQHVEMYETLLSGYKSENPNVDVEIITATYGEFTEKVTTMIATGNPPDITWWSEDSLMYFADKGYFYELDDQIQSWGDEWNVDDFYPSTLEAGQWQDKQYAIPFSTPAPVLYYNKMLFDQANLEYPNENWTWDDFDVAVSALSQGSGAEKVYGVDNLLDKGKEWQTLLNLVRSYGGDFMNEDMTECIIDSPESIQALEKYMTWVNEGSSTKPGIEAPFEQNRVGMFVGWQSFNARFEGVEGLDYDIAYLPSGPAGRELRGGYAGLVVLKTTQYPEESFDLLKFISSQEGIKQQSNYFTPPRKSVGLSEDFMSEASKPLNKDIYIKSLEYAKVTEHFPDFARANQLAQEEIDKMVYGMQPVDQTLELIETRINELLAEE